MRLEVSELKKTVTESLVLGPRAAKRSVHACYGSNTLGGTSDGERGSDETNDLQVNSSEKAKTKVAEVQSLPPLSVIDKSATPIGNIFQLWSVGNDKNRPLKQICEQPATGQIRWASRGIQNCVQRIRYVSSIKPCFMFFVELFLQRLSCVFSTDTTWSKLLATLKITRCNKDLL